MFVVLLWTTAHQQQEGIRRPHRQVKNKKELPLSNGQTSAAEQVVVAVTDPQTHPRGRAEGQ